jgi:hypothetical protein
MMIGPVSDDPYLEYRTAVIESQYRHTPMLYDPFRWAGTPLAAPYAVVFPYVGHTHLFESWGTCSVRRTQYRLPDQLCRHRDTVLARFRTEGKLRPYDPICPRVKAYREEENANPHFEFERALYSDQVATNLSVKFPLDPPLSVGPTRARTVREWEALQLGLDGTLAPFESSLMANSFGVAVGVTARNRNRETLLLMRRRSVTMAVYPGMMHVPFSFSLNLERYVSSYPERAPLRSLIAPDYWQEHGQEMEIERDAFGPIQPLAFCRDLVRCGKPQLFLEMPSLLTFEDLRRRMTGVSGEYVGDLEGIRVGATPPIDASPELVAHMILTRLHERAA